MPTAAYPTSIPMAAFAFTNPASGPQAIQSPRPSCPGHANGCSTTSSGAQPANGGEAAATTPVQSTHQPHGIGIAPAVGEELTPAATNSEHVRSPWSRWRTCKVMVELAVWLAVSVLLCDHVLLRPALFAFHLGREVLDAPSEGRLPTRAAVGRALRRTSKGYWTVTLAALCGPGNRARRRTLEWSGAHRCDGARPAGAEVGPEQGFSPVPLAHLQQKTLWPTQKPRPCRRR